ncbi:hypothetical protein Pelo_8513 [Pelomyxa schiedti]|nr:hypothetical protein Pelo_8513 [Pelomyxa schiedti]
MIARACKQIRNMQNVNEMLNVLDHHMGDTMAMAPNDYLFFPAMLACGGLAGFAAYVCTYLVAIPASEALTGPTEDEEMSARVPAAADSIRAVLSDQIELEEDEFVVLLTENWELVSAELNTRNVRSQVTVRVILHQIRKFGGRHHQDLSDDFVPPVVDGGDGDPFRLSAVLNDLPGHCWVGSSDDMALHVCVLCLALCRITGSAAPWVTQDEMRGVTSLRRLIVANYAPPRVLAQARVALAGWLLYRAKMSKLKRGLASIPTLPPRGDLLRSIVDKAALRKSPNTTTTTNTNTSTSSPTSTPTKPTTPTTPSTTTTMQSSTLASSTLTRSGTVTSSSTTTAPRPRSPPTVTPTSSLRPTTTPTASSTETNSSTLLYPVFSPAKSSCATTAEPTFESGTLKNTVGPKPVVEVDHSDTAVALFSTKFNDEMVWPELADAHYILALCWRMGVGVPVVDKARSRFHTSMAAMISELAPPDQTRVVGGISFSISALSPNRGAVSSMPINAPWQNPNSSKVTILASQVEPTSDKVLALVVMFLQDDKESLLKLRLCNKSLCRIATWVLLSKRTPIPQPLPPVVASSSTLEMLPCNGILPHSYPVT